MTVQNSQKLQRKKRLQSSTLQALLIVVHEQKRQRGVHIGCHFFYGLKRSILQRVGISHFQKNQRTEPEETNRTTLGFDYGHYFEIFSHHIFPPKFSSLQTCIPATSISHGRMCPIKLMFQAFLKIWTWSFFRIFSGPGIFSIAE